MREWGAKWGSVKTENADSLPVPNDRREMAQTGARKPCVLSYQTVNPEAFGLGALFSV
jgi:hypothetical protein